jgi:HEAT repeat protein
LTLAFGCAVFLLGASAGVARAADDLERTMLNRLVQSSGTSDAAMQAFVKGRELIDDEKWPQAAERFNRFITEYPSDKNVDAAYYYLAFAFKKQNKFREADDKLQVLMGNFPKSSWVDDAKKMRIEIAPYVNPKFADDARNEDDDDVKLIALQALCQSQPERCPALVGDVLRQGSQASLRLREGSISLLGRHGGRAAVPVLINLLRNEPEERLRIKAIAALGRSDDESVLEPLREQALKPGFSDNGIVDTALHALANNENPRAVQILGDLAMNAKTIEGRKHAVYLLSRRKGEPVVDELLKIYDADQSLEMRKAVVEAFGNRISPRAFERLVQVARNSGGNLELRAKAVRAISQRGRTIPGYNIEEDLNVLIPLYDSERDETLKDVIAETIGQYSSPRATHKLMDIVRSNTSIERRKKALAILSRSKDPEVFHFLEELLK